MAYVLFIREHESNVESDIFENWMRVVFNFIVNSNIERKERLPIGMSLILSLLPHSGEILEMLPVWKGADELTGNLKQQAREEMIKASLMTSHAGWRQFILRAERHGYFRGQVQFLLEFSGVMAAVSDKPANEWDDEQHTHFQKEFEAYLKKSEAMFNSKGLITTPGHLWERALLAVGDYTIAIGSENRSLLINATSDQGSWKRLLRAYSAPERTSRRQLGRLLSCLADNRPYEEQLREVIASPDSGIEPWRSAVIACPAVFEYGHRRIIRFSEDNLYLPKKTQMNGAHVELFSYCFYMNRLPALQAEGALKPLELGNYEPAIGRDAEPFFELNYRHGKRICRIEVDVMDGACRIACLTSTLDEATELKDALKCLGTLTELTDYMAVKIPRDQMEGAIKKLAEILADALG